MNIAVDEKTAVQDEQENVLEQLMHARKQRRKRNLILLGGAGLLIAAVVFGVYWMTVGRYLEQTDDAYVRADWIPISPKVSGYVAEVMVEDDQPVKAGDVLVRIEDRDYQARLAQARAELAETQASVAAQEANLTVTDSLIAQQKAGVAQAEAHARSVAAELRRASLDQRRYEGLVREHAASAQRLETAAASYTQANAAVEIAKAMQRQQETRLTVAITRRQLAQASLQQQIARRSQAEAQLNLATHALEDTLIRSPIDGVVGQRKVRTRQYVAPGLPLLAVVPLQQAYVVANYKETQLRDMRAGQPVDISVDSYSGRKLKGHVVSFSPGSGAVFALLPSDNATGNFTKIVQRFPVKIVIDEHDEGGPILPGMSVITTVDTRPAEQGAAHD
ncbi:membrane fusion protein, multidrug efflux system [Pseudomonas sp. NFPP02]|uniref:HlyD family secretion protein n=1 Tax=Pseudomonas TaxID=286 RepID=UPI00091FE414|nr:MULTISPECIES: HlyD family secretion protein [Pseudomonas]MBA1297545.1 HlyD family secretion protein [Pseudomonas carnis]MBH3466702.1 HlyD family secretion protein [Pseudomonas carnis]MBJ2199827.1 HlyD family secretion protein [Pseudomonas carnis]SFY20598.1 membrane fusion protein, multidrug efflux system [Pseudomonas sp. NFPP02]